MKLSLRMPYKLEQPLSAIVTSLGLDQTSLAFVSNVHQYTGVLGAQSLLMVFPSCPF